jgi:hypothetical protein
MRMKESLGPEELLHLRRGVEDASCRACTIEQIPLPGGARKSHLRPYAPTETTHYDWKHVDESSACPRMLLITTWICWPLVSHNNDNY